jgi:hypothetical protein
MLAKRAQKDFGSAGVEYIDERVAWQIIYALQADKSRILNLRDWYN